MLMSPKKSDHFDEMPQNEAFSSGYTLFAIKDIKVIQRKKYLFGNDNLWPLDVYNRPSQVCCFKPERKIHKCIKS